MWKTLAGVALVIFVLSGSSIRITITRQPHDKEVSTSGKDEHDDEEVGDQNSA